MSSGSHQLPTCTYRVQMHADFGFDEAAGIADYLAALGISHLYSSPYLQAAAGSTHGYDVVDHSRPNEQLGGVEGHGGLIRALQQHGLGQVLDIVPNHMAMGGPENAWWWDVLQNGQASPFAACFDIDWVAPEARLYNKVLLPILEDHYDRVLEAGQLKLERDGGDFRIRYHNDIVPVNFCSLGSILDAAGKHCGAQELPFIADTMDVLPHPAQPNAAQATRCARDRDVLHGQLRQLLAQDTQVATAVDKVIAEVNADPDALDALLSHQHYRLAYWRTAGQELNYRRFFDINRLVALRSEREEVFARTHSTILKWMREGLLDGLRVDHPDGLRDPQQYFQRLSAAAPNAWIIAEKILEPGERLPEAWPIDGTTGYDFLNRVNNLFVNPEGEAMLTGFYEEFTGQTADFARLAREKKHQILRVTFGGEVNRLTHLLMDVCEGHRQCRDFTRPELQEVLREVIACFPVYRTYIRPTLMRDPAIDDVRHIQQAIREVVRHRPDLDDRLVKFLSDILLLQVRGQTESELVLRFQQLTGPVMAKAIEDTTCYCYNRLISLNEVGGNPGQFGMSLDAFHRECARMAEDWPRTMNTTSTHDTKRSEDTRARINLLSAIPQHWAEAVRRWSSMNERFHTDGMPERNTEYLLYQTLLGTWPIGAHRLTAYMLKAGREAKVHTSWTDPNPRYESAVRDFTSGILGNRTFVDDFHVFVQPLIPLGRINSLAQTLIKLAAPGVPDIYQGCELWDLSLVDPDNRRPVDYDLRRCLLGQLDGLSVEQIMARSDEGLPKLWLTRQALRLRKRLPDVFETGDYRPMMARGQKAGHVVAFNRQETVIAVAPRLIITLDDDWEGTALTLPEGSWRNELTGQTIDGTQVAVADLLERFPVALLVRTGNGGDEKHP